MLWYISTDGLAWTSLADAGIDQAHLSLVANGMDAADWTVEGDYLAAAAYTPGSEVWFATGDGSPMVYVCRFRGRVVGVPRRAEGAEAVSYQAAGAWWWLEQITYAQQWQSMRSTDDVLVTIPSPRIVIGQSDAGARRSLGAEIEAVVAWAAARGAPLVAGSFDALATAPYSEHANLRCADVIRQCLRFCPDVEFWVDYSQTDGGGVPVATCHCRQADNLSVQSVAAHDADPESLSLTPRYDLLIPGVAITYERSHMYDGNAYRSHVLDTAGDVEDPRAVFLSFELQGARTTLVSQDVVTADYPAAGSLEAPEWWALHLPWLADVDPASVIIEQVERSSERETPLPRYLVEGQIAPWMSVEAEDEEWTAVVSYVRRTEVEGAADEVDEDVVERRVSVRLISTDASTRTYRSTTGVSSAEPVPTGVAGALQASWSLLHWDGQITLSQQEVAAALRPGMRVNLTGGLAAWASMAALVQSAAMDLATGVTELRVGPSRRVEADSLVSLFRAANARRVSFQRSERDQAEQEADPSEEGAQYSSGGGSGSAQSDSGDRGRLRRLALRDSSSASGSRVIDLAPAAAQPGDYIHPRRIHWAAPDGTHHTARFLASEPDPIDPSDPPAGGGDPDPDDPPPCGHPGNLPGSPDLPGQTDHPGNTPPSDHPGDSPSPPSSGHCS